MNVPPSSGDDRELRLTALLLGELPEGEAAALREEIAANPELQKLHDELSRTIGLVREARNESPEVLGPSAEPLTLSTERREKLLASFKTVQLPTPSKKVRRILPWREAGAVAAMLAVLAGVTVLLVRTSVLPEDRLAESMDFLFAGLSKKKPGGVTALSAWIQPPEEESKTAESSHGIAREESPASKGDLGSINRDSRERVRAELKGLAVASAGDRLEDRLELEAMRRTPARKLEATPNGVSVVTNVYFAFGSGAQEPIQNPAAAGPQDANGRNFYSRSEISGVPARSVNVPAGEALSRRYRFGGEQVSKNMADHDGDSRQAADQNAPAPSGGGERYGHVSPATAPSGTIFFGDGSSGGGGGGLGGGGFGGGRSDAGATVSAADRFAGASKAKPSSPQPEVHNFTVPQPPKGLGTVGGAVADSGTALGLPRLHDLSRDGSDLTPPPPPPPVQSLAWFEGKVAKTEQTLGTPVQLADQLQTWELKTDARGFNDDFYAKPAAASEPETRFKRNAIDQKATDFVAAGQKAEGQFGERETLALSIGVDAADRSSADVPIQNPEANKARDGRANAAKEAESKDRLQVVAASSGVDGPKDLGAITQRGTVMVESSQSELSETITAGKPVLRRPETEGVVELSKKQVDVRSRQLAENKPAQLDAISLMEADKPQEVQLRGLLTASKSASAEAEDQLAQAGDTAKKKVSPKKFEEMRKLSLSLETAAAAKPAELDSLSSKKDAERKEVDAPALRKPAPNAAVPQPEVATAENAFSTFSLNVSDVSFKLAAASLEKGVMPDAAGVRTEEFINAFDYRDPEPPPGVPIAFATERARYPFAHDRDLVRFSVKTAAAGRQPGKPYNLVLAIDNSGSMERADRVRILQECLRVLSRQFQPQDKISVVSFARTARLWMDGLAGNAFGELPQMIGTLTPEGGTNLEEAMNLAYKTALRHFVAGGVNRVVLITDGAANLGDVEPDSLKQKVEAFRKQGVALDCFGIGWDGLNDDLLEVLSRNGDGRYGFINTPEAAASDFAGQLAGALKVAASDVKVQVEWNPRRVSSWRQIGYAKHQLTKEQFRDNTVDAAEIAAAEAGNALYTVQVNPAGEGPLGTVRVRFRVPNTSDYREHEWIVPYAGPAPALDQSSPTLRLAATASAFSEWLVASPFAAEVTPSKLLGYLSGVPQLTPADPRPSQLETMIRQAKTISGK